MALLRWINAEEAKRAGGVSWRTVRRERGERRTNGGRGRRGDARKAARRLGDVGEEEVFGFYLTVEGDRSKIFDASPQEPRLKSRRQEKKNRAPTKRRRAVFKFLPEND